MTASKKKLGSRVKKFREMKDISLEEMSRRTGLKAEFLISFEEDDIYPSLGPLLKISRALGIRLGTFMDDHMDTDPLVVRKKDRQEELSMLTGKNAPVALKFYSLGKDKSDRHMEPFFIEVLPESAKDQTLSSHEGEEFVVVVSGEIEVLYGKETHRLKEGDSIYYNSAVPHHLHAAGGKKAEIYAILYIPY